MKKLDAVIPARGGSKGVPRKNIKLLDGYPLIAYSIQCCLLSELIDRVYVSSEDGEIIEVASRYGAEIPFVRPQKFARDDSTDNQVLNHFFENVGCEEVVFIRPTTPLRDPSKIDECISNYNTDWKHRCSGIRSMHELPESPYKMYKLNETGYCEGFFKHFKGNTNYTNLPRQVFPKAYHPNGYIDIVKKEQVETGNTFGDQVLPYITPFCIEVDTQDEFDMLQLKLQKGNHLFGRKL